MQKAIIDTYTALAPAFDEGEVGVNDLIYGDFVMQSIEPWMRSALEIGCGVGRLAMRVEKSIPRVLGIDITPAMIQRACARSSKSGVEFVAADAHNYKFTETFDLIYSILAFDTCNRSEMLPKLRQLLNPNGVLLILDRFTWDQSSPSLGDFLTYYKSRFRHHLSFNLPALLRHMPRMMRLLSHPAWQNSGWKALGQAPNQYRITTDQYIKLVQQELPSSQFELLDRNTALISYRASSAN